MPRPIFICSHLDDSGLSSGPFRVYCHLARRANEEGVSWPAIPSIAKTCGMKEDSVWRHLRELDARRMIRREQRTGTSNHFFLTDPSEWLANPPPIGGVPPKQGVAPMQDLTHPLLGGCHPPPERGVQRYSNEGSPEGGAAPASSAVKILAQFPCNGPLKTWDLTETFFAEMTGLYPDLDVSREAQLALAKIKAGAVPKKTAKGMPRFLFSWMARANDSRRGPAGVSNFTNRPESTVRRVSLL